jgi:O-acetylhomoserine/O-acetylserine sulfhydrylase-like pyridoxal-dependent enzyme
MAASFDANMMKQVAKIISAETRAKYHEALRNKNYGMRGEKTILKLCRRKGVHKNLQSGLLSLYSRL